jgi:O-antigen ligase
MPVFKKQNFSFNKLIFLFVFLSLLFSFFNLIPVYPLFFIIGCLLAVLIFPRERLNQVNMVTFWVSTAGVFYILSALLSGLPVKEILSFDFFRRDGNFYISYLPFLILPFVRVRVDLLKYAKIFLYFQTAVTLVLILSVLSGKPIGGFETSQGFVYHFLFVAHNAAGGYYLVVTCLAFALYWFERRNVIHLLIFIINLLALFMSGSRGSQIGLIAIPAGMYYHRKALMPLLKIAFNAFVIFLWAIVIYCYTLWLDADKNPDAIKFDFPIERSHTLKVRILDLWPRALDNFLSSPFVGIGFTRFDDVPQQNLVVAPLVTLNLSEQYFHTDSHAHNTFLHIMAETGIIGLLLFILILRSMYLSSKQEPVYALRIFLIVALWAIIVTGFTENRIVTPSQMLPYNLMLVLSIMSRSHQKQVPEQLVAA